MASKQDIKDVEAIANKWNMDEETRRDFGDYLEDCKNSGTRGTKNERGDFTWNELDEKAHEFLGLAE